MKNQLFKLSAGLLLAAYATSGFAADATGNLTVQANIVGTCSVDNATLYFGTFDTNVGPTEANTPINVTCTSGAPYSVYLGAGTGSGATVTNRSMTGTVSSGPLDYQLYIDNGLTEVWGDGTVGTAYNCGTGTGSVQTYTVYGQIPNTGTNTTASIDTYSDTVIIDVVY